VIAILGGSYDGREVTYPTAPHYIVPDYEAIIGGQERPSPHGDEFVGEYSVPAKDSGFTRRRFLKAAGAGAAYLALAGTVGSEPVESYPKVGSVRTPRVKPLLGVPFPPQDGKWAFRSRPDLNPPAVEVSTQAHEDTAPGYIFVAPEKGGGTGKGGAMIIDDRGQVVWFRPLRGPFGRTMNFGTQTYKGREVLTWGQTPGEYIIFDSSYREIAGFKAANGYNGDHHEFLISPQDTALITIYDEVPRDLTSVGGSKDGVAIQGIVQELDIETGEVLFEWKSIDHVDLEETYGTPSEDHYPGIDYFHINSIDVDPDNNLLISARETSAVYKIDRTSGRVIWRLGGKKSDFEMGPGTRFAFQHDARRLPDGTISIFDNGSLVFENGIPKAVEESRAIVLDLDVDRMRASLVREYTHPDKQYAHAAGNTQVLPNGNVFVGWGRGLAVSEFGDDGELLFDFRVSPEHKSYRAFRFPWSGQPFRRPVAVAERTSAKELVVYASWNGATEVALWEVLAGPDPDRLESLGSIPRDGFETVVLVQTSDPYVAVRAKHRSGRVLGASTPVEA
jgi:Arylsulfotransferase (ASST)